MDDTKKANVELQQLADEISSAQRNHDAERLKRVQAAYLDIVHSGRQANLYEMADFVVHYLQTPKAGTFPHTGLNSDDFPSLMDISDGDHYKAAGYVVSLMVWADGDDIQLNIRRACEECERAFASMIHLNGEERFR